MLKKKPNNSKDTHTHIHIDEVCQNDTQPTEKPPKWLKLEQCKQNNNNIIIVIIKKY